MENGGRMKELKFRIWNNSHNEFIRPDYGLIGFCYPLDGRIAILTTNSDPIEDCVIEQYIGLKDKNGKEIYEGDIVEYDWYIRNDKSYRTKEQVTFDDMGARLGNDRIRNCSNVEVIGNIHENPDLLEKKWTKKSKISLKKQQKKELKKY